MNNQNKEKSKLSMWTMIEDEIREAALNTSFHALGPMYRSKWWVLKVAWFLLFLASSVYCAYTLYQNIYDYLKYDIVTNIYTKLDVPTPLPKITICNDNAIQTQYGYELVKSLMPKLNYHDGDMYRALMNKSTVLTQIQALGLNTQKLGLSLDEMLIACGVKGKSCNSSAFLYSFNGFFGNCYSFNSGTNTDGSKANIEMVNQEGAPNGFWFELLVGSPSSLYSLSSGSGARIYVDNQTIYNSILRGTRSSIDVRRVFIENLPHPYSECTSDEEIQKSKSNLVQLILNTNFTYRYVDCMDLCYVEYVAKKCHCQEGSFITTIPNIPFCFTSVQINCSYVAYADFYNMDVKNYCGDKCPIECNRVEYSLSISSVEYPSRSYYNYLIEKPIVKTYFNVTDGSEISYQDLKQSVLSVFVNYGQLSYSKIETSAKTSISDLIGQLGGLFGLFVGASFLSFFELIELCIVIISIVMEGLVFKIHRGADVEQIRNGLDG